MRRQRNMSQIKEQNKTPEKELNKMETSNLLDAVFKTLGIRMLNELRENINSIKKDQSKKKATLTEVRTNLQGISPISYFYCLLISTSFPLILA